jgi:hypothetical protein
MQNKFDRVNNLFCISRRSNRPETNRAGMVADDIGGDAARLVLCQPLADGSPVRLLAVKRPLRRAVNTMLAKDEEMRRGPLRSILQGCRR